MRSMFVFGLAAMVSTSAHAAVNLVTNGSFENGIAIAGPTFLGTDDTTSMTGWTVTADGVNYADNSAMIGWDASSGVRSVELSSGNGNGGIFQQMSGFETGRRYRLTFDVSANPYDTSFRPRDARVRFSVSGGNVGFHDYQLQNVNTATNMLYDKVVFEWTAGATQQALSIRGAVNPFLGYGVIVDNVTVSAVPELSTWAMLVAGFGLVGAASRRRSRAVAA